MNKVTFLLPIEVKFSDFPNFEHWLRSISQFPNLPSFWMKSAEFWAKYPDIYEVSIMSSWKSSSQWDSQIHLLFFSNILNTFEDIF